MKAEDSLPHHNIIIMPGVFKSGKRAAGRALSPSSKRGLTGTGRVIGGLAGPSSSRLTVPPVGSALPRSTKGLVDVERLYGATPEQLRSAAESYEVESQRLLDAVVEGSGDTRGAGGKSAKKIEEMTARAFRYAGEGRRLRLR